MGGNISKLLIFGFSMILAGSVPAGAQSGAPASPNGASANPGGAQDASQPAPAPAAAPPATAFSYKGFNFSAWLDTYYSKMADAPDQRATQLQAFNLTANKMSLNSLSGSFSYDPAPIGFKLDVGYGRTYDSFMISEPKKTDWARYLINAYVSVKPAAWKGLQIDFGKFVTSAGAEVTETHLNWNYSRSLLFAYGPYFHFGVRAAAPITANWTLGGSVTQGWNVIRDNNTAKTYGVTSVNTLGKVVLANSYYTGPENNTTNRGWRNFYDAVATINWNDRVATYVNFDVGSNRNADSSSSKFLGIASATRVQLTKYLAISPRLEWYNDADGFMTGTAQQIKDFTLTGEVKLNESFLTRLEYRKDWSDTPYFVRDPMSGNLYKDQQLLIASFIMVVKPGMFHFGNGKTK
jgi:hypothetical protein